MKAATGPITRIILAITATLVATPAQAISYGALSQVSTFTPCPSFCGPNPTIERAEDGGEFALDSSASLSNAVGSGAATAMLDGSSLLPLLGAQSFSNPNTRVISTATGFQSYTYTGASATTISLLYTFDGVLTFPPGDDAQIGSRVGVVMGGIPDGLFSSDFPTLFFEQLVGLPGISIVQLDNFGLTNNTADSGPVSFSSQILINLMPGDVITVAGQLQTQASRGASADALGTLSMSFSDDSNLVPIGVVPVPAAVWLMGSALMGLLGFRRRLR